jgi:hypothetical protein
MLAFPTAMGLPEHAVSRFLSANPVLLALVAGLFPGVFEETGRLVAFKTVLRKRRNRETSISYGIGHGGFEVILILGLTYIQYIAYAVMINTGMCIGVMPVIGLTLPFISYGGSSIVTLFAMLGLVSGSHARPQSLSHERYVQPYRE